MVALRTLPMCFWCPELRSRYLPAWHSRIRPNRRLTNQYLTFSIFTSQKVFEVWIVWDCQHRLRKVDEPLVGSVRRKNDQVFFQSDQKSQWCYIRLNGSYKDTATLCRDLTSWTKTLHSSITPSLDSLTKKRLNQFFAKFCKICQLWEDSRPPISFS